MPFDGSNFPDLVLPLLIKGRARIASGWSKRWLHIRDIDGDGYCARGALHPGRVDSTDNVAEFWRAWEGDHALVLAEGALFGAIDRKWVSSCRTSPGYFAGPGDIVAAYNNHADTTHADMLALFDRAIASRLQKSIP